MLSTDSGLYQFRSLVLQHPASFFCHRVSLPLPRPASASLLLVPSILSFFSVSNHLALFPHCSLWNLQSLSKLSKLHAQLDSGVQPSYYISFIMSIHGRSRSDKIKCMFGWTKKTKILEKSSNQQIPKNGVKRLHFI